LRLAAPAHPVSEYRAVSEGAASEGDGEGAQPEESRAGSTSNNSPMLIDAASGGSKRVEGLLEQILDQLRQSEQVRVQTQKPHCFDSSSNTVDRLNITC
jgi:hypothetical protein